MTVDRNPTGYAIETYPPKPSWEDLLASSREWPKLDTPKKRLQAVLNVAKNPAMVLEVCVLTDKPEPYTSINSQVNGYGHDGFVLHHGPTRGHFVQTIEDVGLAARGDTDNLHWAQTPFSREAKAALIFVAIGLLNHDISPKAALGTQSQVKTETPGNKDNIVTSPALVRAQILLLLKSLGAKTRLEDIFDAKLNISRVAIKHHLEYLKAAGLVEYNSPDMTEGYVVFKVATQTPPAEWDTPSQGRRIATPVAQACAELEARGEEINYKNIDRVVTKNTGKRPHSGLLVNVFSHFETMGYLHRNQFRAMERQSEATLTETGATVLKTVFEPLIIWSQDPRAVPEINLIREEIEAGVHRIKPILDRLADCFVDSKSIDKGGKSAIIRALIRPNHKITATEIARHMGISSVYAQRLVKGLEREGLIKRTPGKGTKQHLSPTTK